MQTAWDHFLDEQTHILAILFSSVFFSFFRLFHPKANSFDTEEWTLAYTTIFLVWILFSALNFLYSAVFWDLLIFGRICRRSGLVENDEPAHIWRMLYQIAKTCSKERKHGEEEINSFRSKLLVDIQIMCRPISSHFFKGIIEFCQAVRRGSERRRQIVMRIGVFESGEPLPA
jgi:hypothetical protein